MVVGVRPHEQFAYLKAVNRAAAPFGVCGVNR
jgi:hypothetical protein